MAINSRLQFKLAKSRFKISVKNYAIMEKRNKRNFKNKPQIDGLINFLVIKHSKNEMSFEYI